MTGGEALGRGAWDAGVALAVGHPGAPVTDVLTTVQQLAAAHPGECYATWATNERVALDLAIGASLAGRRALFVTKSVGFNTVIDELHLVNLTGVHGGLVIVLGDDPDLKPEAFSDVPRYIGISLNDDPELIPRQRLHAVPWALTAKTLVSNAMVNGITSTGDIVVQSGQLDVNGDVNVSGPLSVTGAITSGGDISWSGHLGSMNVTDVYTIESLYAEWQWIPLVPLSNSMCFLTKVGFANIDMAGEVSECRIIPVPSVDHWWLGAYGENDSAAWCEARCLQW